MSRVVPGDRIILVVPGTMAGYSELGTLTVQYGTDGTCETTVEMDGTGVRVYAPGDEPTEVKQLREVSPAAEDDPVFLRQIANVYVRYLQTHLGTGDGITAEKALAEIAAIIGKGSDAS